MENEFPTRRASSSAQRAASSQNYLVHLFVISAVAVILLPQLLPLSGTMFRSSKKEESASNVQSEIKEKAAPATLTSKLLNDVSLQRSYLLEPKYDMLEAIIMDLQRSVQMEREKTLVMENDIRILQLAERYLKERLQKVEDLNLETKKSLSYSVDSSMFSLDKSNLENLDASVSEILQSIRTEKERIDALDMEVGKLRKSETNLLDKIGTLEKRFGAFMTKLKIDIDADDVISNEPG